MKKINFKKIINSRNTYFILFVLTAIFLFGKPAAAAAGLSETMGNVVGSIIAIFIRAISSILILLVGVLMNVATYSDFINAPAVAKGWVVVRDLCNMFFVVILLIIAFATILGQEEYGAKKMLPKLIMAAVLINFSKLFCGLMIDISNVVMLTFVNAFSAIGAGNILDMLGIADVTKIAVGSDSGAVTFGMIVSSYIFGLIYIIIATVVVAAMLGMLVVRLVMIWILVVLSPLAFFLQAVPGKGATYAGQWWNKWTSNLLVGPIIAFFLWLSFAALQNSGSPLVATDNGDLAANNSNIDTTGGTATQAGTPAAMAKFVIAIGMLLGGMKIAQEVGGEAGGAMGKVFSKGKGMATAAAGAVGGFALARGKALTNATGRGARNVALGGVASIAGKRDPITGEKHSKIGDAALAWRGDLQANRRKEKDTKKEKFLKTIGFGEKTAEKAKAVWTDIKNNEGVSSINNVLKTGTTNSKYKKAKTDNAAYVASGNKTSDEAAISALKTHRTTDPTYTEDKWTAAELLATKRMQKHDKNVVKIKKVDDNPAFRVTGSALKKMTDKSKRAEEKMNIIASTPNYFSKVGRNGNYGVEGLSEAKMRECKQMANSEPGDKAHDNLLKLVNQIQGTGGTTKLKDFQAEEWAKVISAFKKDGNNMGHLSDADNALKAMGPAYDSDLLTDQVIVNYREFDKEKMELQEGEGGFKYDTFAKNSLKDSAQRNPEKDIMEASFLQVNERAREKGIDMDELKDAPAVSMGSGKQLEKISTVLASFIDDEINSLEGSIAQYSSPVKIASQEKISNLDNELTSLNQQEATSLSALDEQEAGVDKKFGLDKVNKIKTPADLKAIQNSKEEKDKITKERKRLTEESSNKRVKLVSELDGEKSIVAQEESKENSVKSNQEKIKSSQEKIKSYQNDLSALDGKKEQLDNDENELNKKIKKRENPATITEISNDIEERGNIKKSRDQIDIDKSAKQNSINAIQNSITDEKETIGQNIGVPYKQKITELEAAKNRLLNHDLSSLNLKNSDVVFKGSDRSSGAKNYTEAERAKYNSEARREEYNSVQHEGMHTAGAKNEKLVHESSDALQDARLVGKIPGADTSYSQEIGKMIASMEAFKIDNTKIKEAIAQKIDEWKTPNAQRIVEIERGDRQTTTDVIAQEHKEAESDSNTAGTKNETKKDEEENLSNTSSLSEEAINKLNKNTEDLSKAIEKLNSSLDKRLKNISSSGKASSNMSISDANFFRRMFNKLDKSIIKSSGNNTQPIVAMVAGEEQENNTGE